MSGVTSPKGGHLINLTSRTLVAPLSFTVKLFPLLVKILLDIYHFAGLSDELDSAGKPRFGGFPALLQYYEII